MLALASEGRVAAQGNDAFAPAGGRSTLMGNTGVALGRDGSAPFYNPATIVRIRDERLAFAVNFYSLALTNLPTWHQPDALDAERFGSKQLPGTRLLDINFRALPSTLCLFFTLEDLSAFSHAADGGDDAEDEDDKAPTGKKLALCFATLETEDFDSQAIRYRTTTPAGPSTHVQSILRRWGRTYVGPTYSMSLNRQLAIGASLQVVYSADSFGIRSESVSAQLDGSGVSSALSTAGSGRSFELTGTFGATYRLGRVTMGASVRLPSLHIYGDYGGTFTQSSSGGDQAMSTLIEGSGSLQSAPPARLGLGIGIAADRLTLELDGALEVPLQHQLGADLDVTKSTLTADGVDRSSGKEKYAITGHTVFNPSFGMEYFFTKGLSVLSGVSANFSSLQALEPVRSVGNLVHARISHLTASLGLGSYWDGGELLFGLSFDYGFGRTLAVNPFTIPNDWSVVSLHSYSLLFVIAGSTKLSSIVRMVNAITHGGQTESEPAQNAQGEPLPNPQAQPELPAPAAPSGNQAPINPDAREAEGLEGLQTPGPAAAPDPDSDAGTPSE